ncbi:MAG: DMT family transporter [Bacteroidetes bacterium]|nr:DMT family transporter [Bacteroidota bacterium]MCL5026880.1 DMT family transporter [Chloroflexota bacterium]
MPKVNGTRTVDGLVAGGRTRGAEGLRLIGLFLLLCLVWAFAYTAIKLGVRHAPPLTFTIARAVVGGLALSVVALFTTGPFPRDAFTHRSAAILGLCNVAGLAGFMALGLTRISAGESSILTYTAPLVISVMAWVWLGESLSPLKALGLVAGFGGVVVVMAGEVSLSGHPAWLGYALTLSGALAWATGTVYFRAYQARLNILWVTALQGFYGAVPLALAALFLERPAIDWSFELAWTTAYNGLGPMALAYLIWFYLLRHRAAAEVSSYIFLVPFFAVVMGALVLGERLGLLALLGVALILAGIYLVNRQTSASPTPRRSSQGTQSQRLSNTNEFHYYHHIG